MLPNNRDYNLKYEIERLLTTSKMRIFVGHPQPSTLETLVSTVRGLDHEVIGTTSLAREMIGDCQSLKPDMIISGVQYEDMDGIDALIEISEHEPIPAIVIALQDDLSKVEEAMDDHVMAYLVDPVTRDDLRPTIYVVKRRFQQFQELKSENKDLREALAVRKVVERAKGLLMRARDIDEETAYLQLRKMATDKGLKLKDVAELVIDLHS